MQLKILHIEDEKWMHQIVKSALQEQADLSWCKSLDEGIQKIVERSRQHEGDFDAILLDRFLGETDSFGRIPDLRDRAPKSTLLVVSAQGDPHSIDRALELGAHDYLIKTPHLKEELLNRLQVAMRAHRNADQLRGLAHGQDSRLVGPSLHLQNVREQIRKLGRTPINVLITGESGTGKEVVASELHRLSKDPLKPFVAVNCGAIPESLFESELFGHVKGAFTGAMSNKDGLIAAADGGDLFLDEIGDLPLAQQVKLLRFIQEGTYTPVGSNRERSARVRILAATHKRLEDEVRKGRFREDLFYRLDTIRINLLPLRKRPEDIIPLALHLLKKETGEDRKISREARVLLERHSWNGNVRELAAVMLRALIEAQDDSIRAPHIRIQNISGNLVSDSPLPGRIEEVSASGFRRYQESLLRNYFERALQLLEGDTSKLAERLQISRATVYNRLRELKIKNGYPEAHETES